MGGTMYPGKGQPMYLASSNPREPVWLSPGVADTVIPDTDSSIGIAVNPGCQTDVNVLFDAAPAGTAFNVMYDIDPAFGDEYILEAIAATADTLYTFSTQNIRLSGFIRITNAGGQDINGAWLQQTV
jgi:hypothetical protein